MNLAALRSIVAAAVAIATSPVVHGASVPDSLFAVTDVRVVDAPSRLAALDACQRDISGGLSVGIDWGTGPNGNPIHLCQVRTPISGLKGGANVLRRVAVISSSACPADMKVLASPRSGVVACADFAPYSSTVADAGDYVEDLAVTKERNYNNDAPGWTTLPYSLHTSATAPSPSNRGVFLSYRKPVRPVTDLQVLNNVATDDVVLACTKRLGVAWHTAGDIGYLDQVGSKNATVVCTKRQSIGYGTKLVSIAVIDSLSNCPSGQRKHTLSSTVALCSKWQGANQQQQQQPASGFITDLDLHRVSTPLGEGSDPTAAEFLPGNFKLVANRNLNVDGQPPVYLFSRQWRAANAPTTAGLAKPPLTAKATGSGSLSFKILQIADLHYTGDPSFACRDAPASLTNCTEAVMTQWVNDLLDAEKPDFVAFTGDNVETFMQERRQLAMDAVVGGVEARGIPYGMVFGNHDDENGFAREDIVRIAASKPHSYTQRGPVEVDGVGNYELGIKAPVDGPWGAKGSDVFRMYFLDSHGYPDKSKYPLVSASYDWVKPNQIEYYRQLSEAHAAQKNRVPAVMFFHIPLVEYAANAPSTTNGEQYESVASSDVSTNLFSTLVDIGEVKATFVGHDHVNDYCYKRQGIQLCYGGGVGFGRAYGSPTFARRARAIEWTINSNGERTIRSWKRRFGELDAKWLEETLYAEAA